MKLFFIFYFLSKWLTIVLKGTKIQAKPEVGNEEITSKMRTQRTERQKNGKEP